MRRNPRRIKRLVPKRQGHTRVFNDPSGHDCNCLGERCVGMCGTRRGIDQRDRLVNEFSTAYDPIQGILENARNSREHTPES